MAKALEAKVVGILGFDGGKVRGMANAYVVVESNEYGYIEDVHIVFDFPFGSALRRSLH